MTTLSLPAELKSKVLAAASAEPAPTRKGARRTDLVLLGVTVAGFSVVGLWFGGLLPGDRPIGSLAVSVLGWGATALAATWLSYGSGGSMLGRPRQWLLGVAVATPLVLFALTIVANHFFPETRPVVPGDRPALRCFDVTLAMGLWPLVLLSVARQGLHPVHPMAAGAALGTAAGTWLGVLISFNCPVVSLEHIAIGHILPVVAMSVLGALVGRRILAEQAPRPVVLGTVVGMAVGGLLALVVALGSRQYEQAHMLLRHVVLVGVCAALGAFGGRWVARRRV